MARFKGSAEYSIDSKGRLAIPAKMRAAMQPEARGTFTVTTGLDRCVMLYPADVWETKEEEMMTHNQYRQDVRVALRLMLETADDAELDGQGRIGLSRRHLDFAGLKPSGTALVLGLLDHIEVWDPDTYRAHINGKSAEAESLVERVMGGL